jgi:hypothetical protein
MCRSELAAARAGPVALALVLALAAVAHAEGPAPAEGMAAAEGLLRFEEMCDASAVITTADGTLLVGEDRGNRLIVYRETGGKPIGVVDVREHLYLRKVSGPSHAHIEGAARVGDLVYWISSHARTPSGRAEPKFARFFALLTRSSVRGEQARPYELSYVLLSRDLEAADALGLEAAIASAERVRPDLAPARAGLDIQGLAAARDGRGLLIALQAPRRDGKALLIPFLNPDRVIIGVARAAFGEPMALDLGGHGIASIDWVPGLHTYFVVAAPPAGGEGAWKLYRWSGDPGATPVFVQDVGSADFEPQAMAASSDGRRLVLLSDDGDRLFDTPDAAACKGQPVGALQCPCWRVAERAKRHFRGRWIDIDLPGAAEIASPTMPEAGKQD